MIFDVHAHYDDSAFDGDRDELLEKIHASGVVHIINAGTNIETSKFGIEYGKKFDFISAAVGVHPENIDDANNNYLYELEKLSKEKNVVAIGEIGLDYHYEIDKLKQTRIFEQQLELANALKLPVVIHDREAHFDTLQILKKYRPKGILHCYSGSAEFLKEVLKTGMSISLGGTVTFKNARHSVDVAREVPPDRLMLETDAPYLSPVPFRGKRCDSSMISLTAAKIAEIRNESVDEILRITFENACQMFGINLKYK